MRFVIRIGLNAIAGYFLFMLCLFIMGEIAVEGILGETLHVAYTLLLLYFVKKVAQNSDTMSMLWYLFS